jgi:hypothetical protein
MQALLVVFLVIAFIMLVVFRCWTQAGGFLDWRHKHGWR